MDASGLWILIVEDFKDIGDVLEDSFAVLVCLTAVGAAIVGESERVVNAVLLVAKFLVVGLPQRLELFGVLQLK